MDFYATADEADVTGLQCVICDSEILSDQPVGIDIDLGADDRAHAAAAHWWCECAVQKGRLEAFQVIAREAKAIGESRTAETCSRRVEQIRDYLAPRLGQVPTNDALIRG